MAKTGTYTRRINLFINGKEVKNDVKSVQGEMRKLINAQRQMTIGSKEYVETGKQIQNLNGVLQQHRGQLRKTETGWGKLKKMVGGFGAMFAAGITASLAGFLRNVIKVSQEYDKALSSLSAITGATGEDLSWLSRQAQITSRQTLQSATDVVKAYELVGSQRPELLENKEALAEVTKQAIILSEATGGKLGLAEAAAATASTLNQFGLESSEAAKVINVLASGSKYGAAAVPQLAQAMDVFGSVAAAGNVTLEQSVGLLETLAEKNIQGAKAGTNLRNILITLQQDQANYRDGIFDISLALENLSAQQMSVTEMTKMFGKESVVAAQILINGKDKVNDYTEAVTGTTTALEQQGTQNDNLAAKITKLKNNWESFMVSLGNSETVFGKLSSAAVSLLDGIVVELMTVGSKLEVSFKGLGNFADYTETTKEQVLEFGFSGQDKTDWMKILEEVTEGYESMEDATADMDAIVERFKTALKSSGVPNARFIADTDSAKSIIDYYISKMSTGQPLTPSQESDAAAEAEKAAEEAAKAAAEAAAAEAARQREEEIALAELNKRRELAESEITNKIADFRRQLHLETLSANEREIDEINYKYQQLLDTAAEFGLDESALVELRHNEIEAAEKRHAAERLKLKEELEAKIFDATATGADKEIKAVTEKFTELIEMAEQFGLDTTELYRKMNEELDAIQSGVGGGEESTKDIFGMTQEQWDKLYENMNATMDLMGEVAQIWGNINTIMANRDQRELISFEKRQKKQKDILNDRLESGMITQEIYNARVAKMDSELDKKKEEIAKRQADREKKLQIFQAIVNTAAAVIKSLNTPPPLNFVLAGLTAAAGATQIAAISSAPPAYAKGGYTQGERMYIAGEAGREWIASNALVNNPYTAPIISQLESIQRGVSSPAVFAPAQPNYEDMMSIPMMRNGGFVPADGAATPITGSASSDIGQLVGIMSQLNEYMSDPDNRRAYIAYTDLRRMNDEINVHSTLQRIKP